MITKHVFGRTISFRFSPLAGDEDVPAKALVSARLYTSEPTSAQKLNNEAGHVNEKTSWTEEQPGSYRIDFDAQTDSVPNSNEDYEDFYVVVNFTFETGGPTVFVDEIIHVYRPDALTSKIRVTKEQIYARESKIETVEPRVNFVDQKIADAIVEVDRVLRAKGYSRKRTFNRERMNEAVILLATADCCSDLAGEGNQFWFEKAAMWRKRYETARDSIPIGYDSEGDDRPEPEEQTFSGAIAFVR